MTYLHALIIAVLQGATELFPVSSLGHAVIVPALLHWDFNQHAPVFLPFLVLLHLGTAAALLGYFWQDWWALATGVLGLAGPDRARESRHILLLLVIATIPAVILGGLLEHKIRRLFETPITAAIFLTLNGVLLLAGERLRRRADVTQAGPARPMATLTAVDAVIIGLWQCLALLPGLSRSGATITGGLLRGIDHAASARFSFLIALPVILGATVLEVPKLLHASVPAGTFQMASVAAVVAGLTAFASTAFLMRYFRDNDRWALDPFAYYCIAAGIVSGAILYVA
jgi:undecaprenyl-diphosphatase